MAIKPRGRPKGSKNLRRINNIDPDTIGERTRSKLAKGEYDEDGDYLMPVVYDAVNFSCSTGNASNKSKPPSGILKHWTFHNKCQLS